MVSHYLLSFPKCLFADDTKCHRKIYLIQNSPAVKKGAAPKNAVVKKDVKSKVVAKKWL